MRQLKIEIPFSDHSFLEKRKAFLVMSKCILYNMDFSSKNLHKKDLMGLFPIFLTIGRRPRPFAIILKKVTECDREHTFLHSSEMFIKNVSCFVLWQTFITFGKI